MIRTTQNLEPFDKKPFTMLTISDISLAPFWMRFLQVKQLNDAKVFITRLPSFNVPKNDGSLTRETSLKVAVNMKYFTCLLETIRTLNYSFLSVRDCHARISCRETKGQKAQTNYYAMFSVISITLTYKKIFEGSKAGSNPKSIVYLPRRSAKIRLLRYLLMLKSEMSHSKSAFHP